MKELREFSFLDITTREIIFSSDHVQNWFHPTDELCFSISTLQYFLHFLCNGQDCARYVPSPSLNVSVQTSDGYVPVEIGTVRQPPGSRARVHRHRAQNAPP